MLELQSSRNGLRIIGMASILLVACGCGPDVKSRVSVELDYAPTSLGFRNSGALEPGQLMIWDRTNNSLTDIGSDIALQNVSEGPPRDLETNFVDAVKLNAGFNLTDSAKAQAGLAVSQNLKFIVKDAVRQKTSSPNVAMKEALRAQEQNNADAAESWRLEEVLAEPDRYAYVLLTDPVLAMSETITFGSDSTTSSELTITDAVQGQITVSLPKNVMASCKAASQVRVQCFIAAKVLRPVRRADGSVVFLILETPRATLADALRQR